MNFLFLDTETTGIEAEDRLIQVAYKPNETRIVNALFKPLLPIKIEAMATHHITEKMVADKPAFEGSTEHGELVQLLERHDDNVLVAHNAKFDVEMLRKENIVPKNVICTMKVASYLDPLGKIPSYGLQYLRYFLGIDIEATAHDAYGDIVVLELLFNRLLTAIEKTMPREKAIAKMIEVSSQPMLIKKFNFGKHRGEKLCDVDLSYLQWFAGQAEVDEDLKYSIDYWINKRVIR